MAQAIAGGAIRALGVGDPVFAEDGVAAHREIILGSIFRLRRILRFVPLFLFFRSSLPVSLILPQIVCCVLQYYVYAGFAVAVFEQVFYHRAVLFALLFVAGAGFGDDA